MSRRMKEDLKHENPVWMFKGEKKWDEVIRVEGVGLSAREA